MPDLDPFTADLNAALSTMPSQRTPSSPAMSYSIEPDQTDSLDPFSADISAGLSKKLPPPMKEGPPPGPSTAKIIASGLDTGAVAQTLGLVPDVAAGTINAVGAAGRELASDVMHPFDTLEGLIPGIGAEAAKRSLARAKAIEDSPLVTNMPLGSEWWNKRLGEAGLPTTETVHPTTPGGRLLQQAVRSAAAFAAPGLAGKAAAARDMPALAEALRSISPGGTATNLALGAAVGAGGEAAQEMAPESPIARPVGEMATGLAGGVVGAAAGEARNLARAMPPLTEAARQEAANRIATGAMENAASSPAEAMDAVSQRLAADEAELVAGSRPTTAELANDPGLLALQRARSRLGPQESSLGNAIREQNVANNAARVQSLEGMAPASASPEAAQAFLRRELEDIDAMHGQSIEALRQNAEAARDAAQPAMPPEEQGQAAKSAIEAERQPVTEALSSLEQAAKGKVAAATGEIGGKEADTLPTEIAFGQYGAQMRDPVQAAYLAERARLDKIRQAIDPTGTMGMRPDAIKAARQKVAEDFSPDTFGGMENKFYDRIDSWGDLIPIDDAFRLRADINARLKNVGDHSPQEAARLVRVKQGIDQAIDDAVSDTQRLEQAGIINDGLPPVDQRISALENALEIGPQFARDVAAAYAASDSPAARRLGRALPQEANAGNVPLREGAIPFRSRTGSSQEGRPGDRAGDQELPQQSPLTPLTPEAREKFAEWNRDYAAMARRFRGETAGKLHAVGKMLQKGGAYDSFRLADTEVPWLFVNGGKTGREAVERFLEAAPPEAHSALDDAFAFSLRKAAMRPDGTLDLKAYQKWLEPREAALSARPELLEKFNTAKAAQQQLDRVREAIAAHEASHPLNPGGENSAIMRQFWKPGQQGAEGMRRYRKITGDRPEALRAAADYVALDFASRPNIIKNGEVNPRAAEAWIAQHRPGLSELPGLADRFANAAQAQRAVDEAIARHLDARNEFTKSIAGAFLQDDPERAAARLFQGPDRAQKARTLMGIVTGNKAATEGVQRAVIDHIISEFSGAPMAGAEHPTLTPQRLQNFIADNRGVLDIIFPDGQARNFDALAEDLRRSQLAANAKMPGGSDTRELFSHAPGAGQHRDQTVGSLLLALGGEHAGHALVGGVGGWAGAIGAPLLVRLLRAKTGAVQEAANRVLDQMLLDPEFAVEMHRLYGAKSEAVREPIRRRLAQRLMQSTIDAARADDLQSPQAQKRANGGRVSRADGGAVAEPWRDLDPDAQGAHLADQMERVKVAVGEAQEDAANEIAAQHESAGKIGPGEPIAVNAGP